uniref:NIDO domain-containing protein n=1 Tax=Caenorhabditis japonica TaxID=281687 RepID=A0A8R1EHW9_CAEJA
MEISVDELYLSHNGIVGLGHAAPDKILPLQTIRHPVIAVFYAPVSEGNIDYRVTSTDQGLLTKLTQDVKQVFADAADFHALQAIIITWTGIQNAEKDGEASFQLAIISDGMSTYSIVRFGLLPWSSSLGYYAQTGFVHSYGKIQTNVNSGGPDVKELVKCVTFLFLPMYWHR